MDSVNEGSVAYLDLVFKDKSGAEAAPTSATYRIDDLESGQSILPETAIPSLAGAVTITLTPVQNAMVNTGRDYEVHRVTISAEYNSSADAINAEYDFQVNNLRFV